MSALTCYPERRTDHRSADSPFPNLERANRDICGGAAAGDGTAEALSMYERAVNHRFSHMLNLFHVALISAFNDRFVIVQNSIKRAAAEPEAIVSNPQDDAACQWEHIGRAEPKRPCAVVAQRP